jgi:hypothetical protein
MSLESELRQLVSRVRNFGQDAIHLADLEKLLPQPTSTYLFVRFGCGHEQRLEDDDDAASFLENARHQPCDACVGKKLKSLDL